MKRHFDKRPNNALIAKAVEICATEGKSHFIYGSYVYYDPNSSLTEFKRRNGFEPVALPRYFIPLTLKGKLLSGARPASRHRCKHSQTGDETVSEDQEHLVYTKSEEHGE